MLGILWKVECSAFLFFSWKSACFKDELLLGYSEPCQDQVDHLSVYVGWLGSVRHHVFYGKSSRVY